MSMLSMHRRSDDGAMKATHPLLLVLTLTAAAACDDKKPTTTTTPTPSASESSKPLASAPVPSASSSSEPRGEHMRGMRGGLTAMLVRGAKDLDLKDDQKPKLEKLAADLKSDHEGPMSTEGKDLHTELVTEVRAGKIEQQKIDQKLGAIEKAAQAAKDKEADTLNQLHALLDAGQRKTLVGNVKAQRAGMQMRGRLGFKRHLGGDADGGPVVDGGPAAGGAKLTEEMAKRQTAKLTKELDLDADQQKKVEALSAKNAPPAPGKPGAWDPEKMQAQMDASLAAFEGDTFDAKKLDGYKDAGKNARTMAQRQVQMFADLVPVLKPEQREKLAKHLEAGPSRKGHGGPPGMMPPMLFEDDDDASE
jgi:Spy/CpxP family protein refolding chaperone